MFNNYSKIRFLSLKQVFPIEKLSVILFPINSFTVNNITHFVSREEFLEQNVGELSLRCVSDANVRSHFIVSEELRKVGKFEIRPLLVTTLFV